MKILLATLLVFGLASSEEESFLDIKDYVTNLEVSGYRVLTSCTEWGCKSVARFR